TVPACPILSYHRERPYATSSRDIRTLAAPHPAMPSDTEQPPSCTLVAPHVAVNRHMAQAQAKPFRQLAGNLLRAPLFPGQKRLDLRVDRRRMVLHPPATPPPAVRLLLSLARHV